MTGLVATYRVQMRNGVDFAHLSEQLGCIARLGASHLYLSPVFTARTGSTHGYDVTRPDEIDPALGGLAAFEAFAREAARHGLCIVLDIVPNHVAASVENPWRRDVLEHGRASRYAGFFDIDREAPPAPGRIALPVLGMPFAEALAAGEIRLVAGPDGPELACHDLRLPLRPESRRLGGRPPEAVDGDPCALLAVLDEQHYAPVYWRALPDRLDWRRFFDITELVGLRIEEEEVFRAVHRPVFDLVRRGFVHGLRIDHIDGLADPAGYLHRLRAGPEACGGGPDFPLWVEKILGPHETLRRSWPVSGTTGYEVPNDILQLLRDGRATRPLGRLWRQVSGDARSFAEVVTEARLEVLEGCSRASTPGSPRPRRRSRRAARRVASWARSGSATPCANCSRVCRSIAAMRRVELRNRRIGPCPKRRCGGPPRGPAVRSPMRSLSSRSGCCRRGTIASAASPPASNSFPGRLPPGRSRIPPSTGICASSPPTRWAANRTRPAGRRRASTPVGGPGRRAIPRRSCRPRPTTPGAAPTSAPASRCRARSRRCSPPTCGCGGG